MKNGAGARLDGGLAVSAPTVMAASIARERRRVLADLVALAKPRVVLMILVTAAVGYYVGLAGAPDYARLLHLLVGTLLAERVRHVRVRRRRAFHLPSRAHSFTRINS